MRRQHVRNLNSNDVSNQMKGHCRKRGRPVKNAKSSLQSP